MSAKHELLYSIFKKNNLLREYKAQEPIFVWTKVSGELGKIARPKRMRGNTLIIDVPSAAAKQELSYLEEDLLDKLNDELSTSKVNRLKFQIGEFPSRTSSNRTKYSLDDVTLSSEELQEISNAVCDRGLNQEAKDSLKSLLITQLKSRKVRIEDGWKECPNCGGIYDGTRCPYCGIQK